MMVDIHHSHKSYSTSSPKNVIFKCISILYTLSLKLVENHKSYTRKEREETKQEPIIVACKCNFKGIVMCYSILQHKKHEPIIIVYY